MTFGRLVVLAWVVGATSLLSAQGTKPDRIVQGHSIVSQHDPRATITLPAQAIYVGADRWILYDVADCEVQVFIEADANKVVQRLYWIQFEGYVPSRPELKHNYTDPVQRIQGIDFHVKSFFNGMDEWTDPGSDGEHVRKLVESAGFVASKGIMYVRLVHLLDLQMRKELMVIYGESLDARGIAKADLKPGGKAEDRWPELQKELVQHAGERIQFSPIP